jgi:hypothetical protein
VPALRLHSRPMWQTKRGLVAAYERAITEGEKNRPAPVRSLADMTPEERAALEQQFGAPVATGPKPPRKRRPFRRR